MADSDEEKTLDPSERKIRKSREEGQVARSRELSSGLASLVMVMIFYYYGPVLLNACIEMLQFSFNKIGPFGQDPAHDEHTFFNLFFELAGDALLYLSPLFIGAMLAGVYGSIALGGMLFSPKAFMPKFSRMNPLSWFKRVFSMTGAVELLKSLAKVIVLGALVTSIIYHNLPEFAHFTLIETALGASAMGERLTYEAIILAGGLCFIAALDVPFQWWKHNKDLKMSHKEMKDEHKDSEGNPQIKSKIRSLQRQRARGRMMQAVPTADVIVTNPTRYAVALKYEEGVMRAPKVVAKGRADVANKIRTVAGEHKVNILESPALARALYAYTELEAEIPRPLYKAVAQVLAFVYELKSAASAEQPVWTPMEIPDEWDPFKNNGIRPKDRD